MKENSISIHFNRPYMTGREMEYIRQAASSGKLSGNGEFTHRCQNFFEKRYSFKKCLLTTSGTDALEMAAILSGVGPGDEVIVPSYTFVSTALAFIRCGAKVVFADSRNDEPNIDAEKVEELITPRTKVIVPVHYAGCACDMKTIMNIATRHHLLVIEDAAQAIDSYFLDPISGEKKALGGIGHLGCLSFHETKNIIAGEGGMLVINDESFMRRAEIIWEKGTNRAEFFRGEVNKYGWVDIGSSFLPSEITTAFLWAQLEKIDEIQAARIRIWEKYFDVFSSRKDVATPLIPTYSTNNAHMFYLLFPNLDRRSNFISKMKEQGILCVFHYLPLHSSMYYKDKHDGRVLTNCDRYADVLVRLPLYCGLDDDQEKVIKAAFEALGS